MAYVNVLPHRDHDDVAVLRQKLIVPSVSIGRETTPAGTIDMSHETSNAAQTNHGLYISAYDSLHHAGVKDASARIHLDSGMNPHISTQAGAEAAGVRVKSEIGIECMRRTDAAHALDHGLHLSAYGDLQDGTPKECEARVFLDVDRNPRLSTTSGNSAAGRRFKSELGIEAIRVPSVAGGTDHGLFLGDYNAWEDTGVAIAKARMHLDANHDVVFSTQPGTAPKGTKVIVSDDLTLSSKNIASTTVTSIGAGPMTINSGGGSLTVGSGNGTLTFDSGTGPTVINSGGATTITSTGSMTANTSGSLNLQKDGTTRLRLEAGRSIMYNNYVFSSGGATFDTGKPFEVHSGITLRGSTATNYAASTIEAGTTTPLAFWVHNAYNPASPGSGWAQAGYFDTIGRLNLLQPLNMGNQKITNTAEGTAAGEVKVEPSDARIKRKVSELVPDESLQAIKRMRAVRYKYCWDTEEDSERLGFIAQELKEVLPEAVGLNKGYAWYNGEKNLQRAGYKCGLSDCQCADGTSECRIQGGIGVDDYYFMDSTKIIPLLVSAMSKLEDMHCAFATSICARLKVLEDKEDKRGK